MKLGPDGEAFFVEKVSLKPPMNSSDENMFDFDPNLITSPMASPRPMSPVDPLSLSVSFL
jgi:hypothetical protein